MDSKTKWRQEHREHIRAYNARYRAGNPAAHLCDCGRRAFKKKGCDWVCVECDFLENSLHIDRRGTYERKVVAI